jgi:putative flippase GtrA
VLVRHFVRFAMAGVLGFVVDAAALLALRSVGLDLLTGRVGSFLIAATATWYLNRRFTFRDRPTAPAARQWSSFLAANSLGGALNYGVYAALVTLHPFLARHPVPAVAAGAIAGLGCNFTLSRSLVFRQGPARPRRVTPDPARG